MRIIDPTRRLAVVGQTGTGKTLAGLWQLSEQDFSEVPWLILDYKQEALITRIPGIQTIAVGERLPDEPGLYRVCPQPQQEDEVTELLWDLWRRERTGLFVDEGYMLNTRNPAYNAILTQGRTKWIPVITLSQRPVFVSRFAFSEANFLQVFHLNDKLDRDTMQRFFPSSVDIDRRLPKYHSYYYDVAQEEVLVLRPVPGETEIMEAFAEQLIPPDDEPVSAKPVDRVRFV